VRVVPLKTAPLVLGDDVSTVAKGALEAAGLEPDPSDVLVVRGSSLAVTQGRVVDIAEVRPTPVARLLCRLCSSDSFLANPYSFQVAVDLAGLTRVLLALAVDRYSRLLDRGPDFHRVAGRQVAWMDDTAGSLALHALGHRPGAARPSPGGVLAGGLPRLRGGGGEDRRFRPRRDLRGVAVHRP